MKFNMENTQAVSCVLQGTAYSFIAQIFTYSAEMDPYWTLTAQDQETKAYYAVSMTPVEAAALMPTANPPSATPSADLLTLVVSSLKDQTAVASFSAALVNQAAADAVLTSSFASTASLNSSSSVKKVLMLQCNKVFLIMQPVAKETLEQTGMKHAFENVLLSQQLKDLQELVQGMKSSTNAQSTKVAALEAENVALKLEVQAAKDQLARVELAQSEQAKALLSIQDALQLLKNQVQQQQQPPAPQQWPLPSAPQAPKDNVQRMIVTYNTSYVPNVTFTLGYTCATSSANKWVTLIAQQNLARMGMFPDQNSQTFKVHVKNCDDSKTGGLIIGLAASSTIQAHKENYFIGQLGESSIVACGLKKNDASLCGNAWPIVRGTTFAYGLGDTITITVNWETRTAKFECKNEWFELGNLPNMVVPVVSLGYANQTVVFSK